MIRINLLPLKEAERAVGRRQQVLLALLGLLVALLAMIVPFMIQGRRLAVLDRDIEDVQEQIKRFNDQVQEVRDLDRVKAELEAKLRIIEDLNEKRVGPARVLADLSAATPDNLWLMDFSEADAAATLTGMALDNETIARFMRQLQESLYFHSVDLVETSRNPRAARAGANQPQMLFTRFIIKARIDYFGRDGEGTEAAAKGAQGGKQAAKPGKPAAKRGKGAGKTDKGTGKP